MNARNKVVLNHAHSGWIDAEVIVKAVNSELDPADFAEQRGKEGFSIMCVFESELSGYLMRWDDAYNWIYRYSSPEKARDVLEQALKIKPARPEAIKFDYPLYGFLTEEEKEFQVALEENFGDDEDEDIVEILSSLQEIIDKDDLAIEEAYGQEAAPDGWVKLISTVQERIPKKTLEAMHKVAIAIAENSLDVQKFDGELWCSVESVDVIVQDVLYG